MTLSVWAREISIKQLCLFLMYLTSWTPTERSRFKFYTSVLLTNCAEKTLDLATPHHSHLHLLLPFTSAALAASFLFKHQKLELVKKLHRNEGIFHVSAPQGNLEILLKTTIHCPNQTQSCSIPVPTAPAAVLTSVFHGTFSKEWRFLCQDLDVSQNRIKSVRSLEICTRHKNYLVSNRIQDPTIPGAGHDMLLKKPKTSCLKCLPSLHERDKLSKRMKLGCT